MNKGFNNLYLIIQCAAKSDPSLLLILLLQKIDKQKEILCNLVAERT